jgi:hypothetical protein
VGVLGALRMFVLGVAIVRHVKSLRSGSYNTITQTVRYADTGTMQDVYLAAFPMSGGVSANGAPAQRADWPSGG